MYMRLKMLTMPDDCYMTEQTLVFSASSQKLPFVNFATIHSPIQCLSLSRQGKRLLLLTFSAGEGDKAKRDKISLDLSVLPQAAMHASAV